jgi:hypothetical protein
MVVVPPLLCARFGVRGPYELALDLGPKGTPYLSGFVQEYEVEGWSRAHWSTRAASIQFPIAVQGGPLHLSYRFARPLIEPAVVSVEIDGLHADHFFFPGGAFRVRDVRIPALAESPLSLSFLVDSTDRERLGLRFDWVRFDLESGARARLTGWAAWAPALVVLLLWLVLLATGWPPVLATALTLPASCVVSFGLLTDPWLTHRVIRGLPLTFALFGIALASAVRFLKRRGLVSPTDGRRIALLMTVASLIRAGGVSHPDFYHPDQRTHARFVEVIREAGADFFRSPSMHILRHGVWKREAYGREYTFPYSPGFHLAFVPLQLDYDGLVTLMPVVAAFWSTVPIAILWVLARRLGLSTIGAALMVVVPTYMSRLSFAFLPSLFGHAVDVGFVYWISTRLGHLEERRVFLSGILLVAACQLAYVSGVLNLGAFALTLVLILALKDRGRVRRSLALIGILALGSSLSMLLYYRDFVGVVLDLVPRALGPSAEAEALYPPRSFLAVSYERTRSFFDGIYPVLTAAGLFLVARKRLPGSPVLNAWVAAYFLLLLGRAKLPDIFLRGHEALFVTPLVCLASGEALARLIGGGGLRRVLASLLLVVLAVQGIYFQWQAVAAQMHASP